MILKLIFILSASYPCWAQNPVVNEVPNLSVTFPDDTRNLNEELNRSATRLRDEESLPRLDKTVLFFDLNFAPSEILSAKIAAQSRGENILIYPERTEEQQTEIDKRYRIV